MLLSGASNQPALKAAKPARPIMIIARIVTMAVGDRLLGVGSVSTNVV